MIYLKVILIEKSIYKKLKYFFFFKFKLNLFDKLKSLLLGTFFYEEWFLQEKNVIYTYIIIRIFIKKL